MTGVSLLVLGMGLGLRHATDADHLIAISTLLQREPGARRAVHIAALWGAGHTVSFLCVGVLVVIAGLHVPPEFETYTDLLVGVMLIGLGAWHLVAALRTPSPEGVVSPRRGHARATTSVLALRPLMVGIVHGLAGSAGIALLTTMTIPSKVWAVAYLGLFGIGVVAGMVALTLLLSWPLAWMIRKEGYARRGVSVLAGLLSLGLGMILVLEAVQPCGQFAATAPSRISVEARTTIKGPVRAFIAIRLHFSLGELSNHITRRP